LLRPQFIVALLVAVLCHLGAGSAEAARSVATDWVDGHNSKVRLLVGGRLGADGAIERYAALEIQLAPGWKTYWRQPGSAGGIPPAINSSGSVNLDTLDLRFPAPQRFIDSTGHTIGYKKAVVFPIALKPQNPDQPVTLNLNLFFGVCREICIPAEAAFKQKIEPQDFTRWPPELAAAVAALPTPSEQSSGRTVPVIKRIAPVSRSDGQHALIIDVHYPGGSDGADLFAERGDGMGLAMTEVIARPSPDITRFRLPIEDGAEWAKLGETGVALTMTSKTAASTARRPRP